MFVVEVTGCRQAFRTIDDDIFGEDTGGRCWPTAYDLRQSMPRKHFERSPARR
jgi:hypothetical protein